MDQYLDQSIQGAYLNGDVLCWLRDFLINGNKNDYDLITFCIMPNHVHLLLKPLKPLAKVIQKIKGSSAKQINTMMGKSGRFWANDYYDRLIRNEKHFNTVYAYIENNPLVLSEAKASPPRLYSIYQQQEMGLQPRHKWSCS